MEPIMRIKLFIFIFIVAFATGQSLEYPPPTDLVTIPTAGTLTRGSYALEMRIQRNGGLTAGLSVGITDRFMFGLSYGASYLIGDTIPVAYPRPEANVKYHLIDETTSMPGISIGINTQGFGDYNSDESMKRYEIKAYGVYLSASKNWKTFMGNLGIHGGTNYNFTERTDGDEDPNLFFGMDMEFNPELSIMVEYNAAFNENDETAKTMSLNSSGYLNAAVRWTFVDHLHIELDFNNLLFDENRVDYFSRELKITYIEYF